MEEAKAAILAIVDPPKAELGKVYNGRVVNITKFGAFVNILPGRDGLVHISKLGRGKRINAVEDVLQLGQEIEVRVDEIDDKGKVSLSPVGDAPEATGDGGSSAPAQRPPPAARRRQRLVRGGLRRRARRRARRPRPRQPACQRQRRRRPRRPQRRSRRGRRRASLIDAAAERLRRRRADRSPLDAIDSVELTRCPAERISQLASGLTIATDHVPGARSVAIGVWVAVGSRDEPAELSGVSHFLEHLLFKGTATRSATDISRAVDRVGGDINAFTSKEYTAYYCRMPRRHGATGIELLGDVLTSSLIADADVESERQVILEELAMDDDSPDDVALRTLARQLFGDHGLGRDTAGERATVRSIRPADVRDFFAEHYRTGATTVAVAGDVDHDDVVAEVDGGVRRHAGRRRPGRAAARPGGRRDRRRHRRRLRAGPPGHRRPVGAARRSRPRGARRRQPRLRRRAVEPPVRRDPRAPRPGLQRVLGDVGVRRRRRLVGVRRLDARARRRGRAG